MGIPELIFGICAGILYILGLLLGLNYMEISVYFNLYLQGILPIVIGFWVLCKVRKSWIKIIFTLLGILFNGYIFKFIFERYPYDKISYSFNKCVEDLKHIAELYNSTYVNVNLYIFIITFLLNLMYYYLILKIKN